jgi:hypothetical protein
MPMNYHYYYFIFFLAGAAVSGIITYYIVSSLAKERFRIHCEKHKLARFINSMKKLKKKGESEKIERSVKKFSAICIHFSPKSFEALKMKDMAIAMKDWELEFFMPTAQQNGVLPRPIDPEIFTSEKEKLQTIIDMFYVTIGI